MKHEIQGLARPEEVPHFSQSQMGECTNAHKYHLTRGQVLACSHACILGKPLTRDQAFCFGEQTKAAADCR